MAVLVIAAYGKAPVIELAGQGVVATRMLAQAMHQQNHAAQGLPVLQRPVLNRQVVAIAGHKSGERALGVHQGTWAITWATAAVSFLAYGTCKNSFGPCALLLGPSTPHTIIWALGKPLDSMLIKGMVPPWPM